MDELAHLLNLKKVGWIFTDLIADDVKRGTVNLSTINISCLKVKCISLINSISFVHSGETRSKRRKSLFVCSRVHYGGIFSKSIPKSLSLFS